jgi:outer membrane protein assembly factor BamB
LAEIRSARLSASIHSKGFLMKSNTALKRGALAGISACIFVLVLLVSRAQTTAVKEKEDNKPAPGDWVMFGGTHQRNFVNTTEKGILDDWDVSNNTNIKWAVDPGSKAYGGPIVAGGKVYIGTNNDKPRDPAIKGDRGVLMCFDEKTGKFQWQLAFDKLPVGRAMDWPEEGICSSPTVEGNRLYFVSNRCEVICADVNGDPEKPGKGKILWTYDMIGKQNVYPHNLAVCSPLIVGDLMFITTANGVDEKHITVPSPDAPSFLCLTKKDGSFVWKNNLPSSVFAEYRKKNPGGKVAIRDFVNKGQLLMHGQWSNPVYAEPMGKPMVIFPGGDGWLYAFKPADGELLWKFDCNPKDSFYELGPRGTRNDFIGTPVVHDNKLYIGVGQDPEHKEAVGHLWCIDISKEPKNKDKDLSPATNPGKEPKDPPQTIFDPKDPKNKDSALVWHYGGTIPDDVKKAKKIKRAYWFGRSMSTCAVHDGLLYTSDLDGYIYCFDAATGEKYWDYFTKSNIWGSPYWVDGKVYVGTDDDLFIFKHGKEKPDPKQIEMGGKVRASPVAANGTLFVLTESASKLLAIGKK